MKTPREILLARHQTANAKLDEIRRTVIADLKPPPAPKPEISFAVKFWRELIWPCRRTWSGLAAVWIVILIFNRSQSAGGPVAITKSPAPPAEMRLALQEQQRLLAEIIGSGLPATAAEPPRRSAPKPRSERNTTLKTA